MIAVDFSAARPTIAQLKAAGVTIVIRYLTGTGNKPISPIELAYYATNGICVAFVFEIGSTDAQGGYAAGRANAQSAAGAMAALGVTAPIYFAVDQSINPPSAVNYFQGINSVLQPSSVGIYGEGALCTLLQQDGLATWFWQSESTSFPGNSMTLAITHLQQKYNDSPVPGTDLDIIMKSDVGQWPRPVTPTPLPIPTPPPHSEPRGTLMLHTVTIPTDGNGNGYALTAIPWATFQAISVEGSDPAPTADNRYFMGTPHVQDRDGNVLASVTGCTLLARRLACSFSPQHEHGLLVVRERQLWRHAYAAATQALRRRRRDASRT